MSILTEIYNFLTASKYTYNTNQIELNPAKLKLQQGDVNFTQDFDNDTGFTYDNTKAEFTGGLVRQKDQRNYSNASFEASYNSVINGTRGLGVLTGTPINGATITGAKLNLTGGRSVNYDANLNADGQQTLCIKFKVTPNFTGAPPTDYPLITICKSNGDSDNIVMIRLQSNGQLQVFIQDFNGAVIINSLQGVWNNISGIRYEFGLNVDITSGATRLFVENKITGICEQFGSTLTDTGTRDSNIAFLNVGGNYNNIQFWDGYIEDLVIFNSVQNTTDYTADEYSVPDYLYAETSVILPEMEHTGDGTIKLFNAFLTTESGTPRYVLQIGRSGNYLYWNGTAWATSDGTPAQATDSSTFDINCGDLSVDGEEYGQFKIIFSNSNTISSVSVLTANMNVDIGYLTSNPTIKNTSVINADSISNILMSTSISGSDAIKMTIEVDGIEKYWSGTAWATSSGYSQSNILADIVANLSTLLADNSDIRWILYLHSDDGSTTPAVTQVTISYNLITITVGTNSWVTLTEANDFLDQIFDNDWSNLTEVQKKQLLITAFWLIYTYPEISIEKSSTEEKVKIAQIKLAEWLYNYYDEWKERGALIAGGVKSFSLSKWREVFNRQSLPFEVLNLLDDSLLNSGGYFPLVERELE